MTQCRAKSKRSGVQCKKHAVKGKAVCRIYGAYAGPERIKESKTKHGMFTKEAFQDRARHRDFLRECRNCLSY